MTEYTVTGIRYAMGHGLSLEEMTSRAKEFIKGIKVGSKVILEAEPDNPADENAIMVFVDYKLRGHIAREQCLEVRQLLDENMQADAVVTRNDEELAFFVTIPGAEERNVQLQTIPRILPESPLGSNVRMPFSNAEKTLDMLAKKLTSMDVTKDSIPDFIEKAEHYAPLLDMTICYSDDQRLSVVVDRLNSICRKTDELEICKDYLERIQRLRGQLSKHVHNMHRRWDKGLETKFVKHLDCLRADTNLTHCLYTKYCETYLCANNFADADQSKMLKERERLLKWFEDMKWSELRDHRQLEKMASKLSYLRVSRAEIYDVYSILLLLEQLDEYCQGKVLIEEDELALPKELDTKKARQCFVRAIKKKYMEKADDGKYRWLGTNDKGNRSELAYFCGKVYGYVYRFNGNAGEKFPEESLNNLFGVTRLYSSLTQVYNAQKPQSWRRLIDEICD
ncbi:MAG: hypothetical protein J5797_12115 [Prevotella sp.]|nr:hypothetical protein [Prevotella sp.]